MYDFYLSHQLLPLRLLEVPAEHSQKGNPTKNTWKATAKLERLHTFTIVILLNSL